MSSTIYSPMQKVELLKEIARNPKIPSPPTVVLNVLEKASQPDCTINDLCKIIQIDPGLAGNILRIVNSATFGLSRAVTSIQRALAVVGLNSARLLVLSIAFPKMQQALKLDPNWASRYWKSSIAGAIVARELAIRMRYRDPEDDMAAGLLRDLGELVLQQIFPEAFVQWTGEPDNASVLRQCELEETHFGLDHAETGAFILDRWRLPVEMTEAVKNHHHPEQGSFSTPVAEDRAYLLHFATRAAALLVQPDAANVVADLRELAQVRFGMDEQGLREFLAPLTRKTSDFAALLQVDIGSVPEYENILMRAGGQFEMLAIAMSRDNQRAAEQTHRAESEARHWQQEAAFDPLTKVFNRRLLESRLRDLFRRRANENLRFGLLFIDLDGFKTLNDRHGHPFGDFVLRKVAECITGAVRDEEMVVRFGGDEFCVLSENINDKTIQTMGNRVWTRINELTFQQGHVAAKLGASIGAAICDVDSAWTSAEEFLEAADKAMYRAKSNGKNQVMLADAVSRKEVNPENAATARVEVAPS